MQIWYDSTGWKCSTVLELGKKKGKLVILWRMRRRKLLLRGGQEVLLWLCVDVWYLFWFLFWLWAADRTTFSHTQSDSSRKTHPASPCSSARAELPSDSHAEGDVRSISATTVFHGITLRQQEKKTGSNRIYDCFFINLRAGVLNLRGKWTERVCLGLLWGAELFQYLQHVFVFSLMWFYPEFILPLQQRAAFILQPQVFTLQKLSIQPSLLQPKSVFELALRLISKSRMC